MLDKDVHKDLVALPITQSTLTETKAPVSYLAPTKPPDGLGREAHLSGLILFRLSDPSIELIP
jgi:hypothetical protein